MVWLPYVTHLITSEILIFERKRDDCQTLAVQDPYLVLTGPMRGVVLCDYVVFEVSLYVRGTADSDDRELSLLSASCASDPCPLYSFLTRRSYTRRLSTLDFKLGHIVCSVEATINVRVVSGRHTVFMVNLLPLLTI